MLTVVMPHRDGLNVRAAQSDNAQVSIEMGQGGYDLDSEIEGLRTDVGRLKQVSPVGKRAWMSLICCHTMYAITLRPPFI